MGTIKFEVDIPEFEDEININVTIKRDGRVISSTSNVTEIKQKEDEKPISPLVGDGNLMNIEF